MADLLVRDVPDDVVRAYEAHAKASGKSLGRYVREVLVDNQPVALPASGKREALLALTKRNLARGASPLRPMARSDFREGMEE